MTDIIERLRDPEFAGPMRHLQDWSEIDQVMAEAATEIASLRRELEEAHRNALREAIAAIAGKIDEARSFGVEGRELTAMGWSLSAVQELLERWPPKPAAAIRALATGKENTVRPASEVEEKET